MGLLKGRPNKKRASVPRPKLPQAPVLPPAETQVASRLAFDGKLIKLRVDRVRLANGRQATREVVEHPGAVAIVPVLDDGRVLLVRQFRYAAGEELLEIPAGTLGPEERPRACAVRELMEEIGHRPSKLVHLADLFLAPGYSTELIRIYRAEGLKPAEAKPDDDEVIEPVALTPAALARLILTGKIRDAKTICGLLLSREVSRLLASGLPKAAKTAKRQKESTRSR